MRVDGGQLAFAEFLLAAKGVAGLKNFYRRKDRAPAVDAAWQEVVSNRIDSATFIPHKAPRTRLPSNCVDKARELKKNFQKKMF